MLNTQHPLVKSKKKHPTCAECFDISLFLKLFLLLTSESTTALRTLIFFFDT